MSEEIPIGTIPPTRKAPMQLRKAGSASIQSVEPPPPPMPPPEPPSLVHAHHKPANTSLGLMAYTKPLAFLLFLVVGGLTWALRYDNLWHIRYEMETYGPYVILVCHLIVVAFAFKEELFAGLLCLLLPGYSLYYMVARGGHAFFTALVCGLLVGLGEDTWEILKSSWTQYYNQLTRIIRGT